MRTELTEDHLFRIFEFWLAWTTIIELYPLSVRFTNKKYRVAINVGTLDIIYEERAGLEEQVFNMIILFPILDLVTGYWFLLGVVLSESHLEVAIVSQHPCEKCQLRRCRRWQTGPTDHTFASTCISLNPFELQRVCHVGRLWHIITTAVLSWKLVAALRPRLSKKALRHFLINYFTYKMNSKLKHITTRLFSTTQKTAQAG